MNLNLRVFRLCLVEVSKTDAPASQAGHTYWLCEESADYSAADFDAVDWTRSMLRRYRQKMVGHPEMLPCSAD